ncbi:type VI secretion system TssO [Chishuiella sp.]|uniref:type VI secretion system TssO n=1 Tax=Chishuiella sp. TaxID=1969467 RepID=UPI0028B0C909|nr:type VI secretion system TssO [Chishuiella sp.]
MQVQITLSKKEKRYYFSYLLGMLLLVSVLFSVIFIKNFNSPFNNHDVISIQTLNEKNKFDEQQSLIQPILDSTFVKIDKLKLEKRNSVKGYELENSISDIANFFELGNLKDSRKDSYLKIAKFYKMYLDDKKNNSNIKENVMIYKKQFEDCSIGYQTKQQQILQLTKK